MSAAGGQSRWGGVFRLLGRCLRWRRGPPLLDGVAAEDRLGDEQEAWPKVLFLVRHGESTYNAHYARHGADPMDLFDAPLSDVGEAQARAAGAAFGPGWAGAGVELALTSPLTRAARTCLLAMPPGGDRAALRYEVVPLLTEHLEASCDIGRPPAELRRDLPELSFDDVPDVWWYVPEEHLRGITVAESRRLFVEEGRREPNSTFRARVDAFARLLAGRRERRLAAFAHADFFHELLARHFGRREPQYQDYWMKNCEVLRLEVFCADDLLHPFEEEAPPVLEAPPEPAPAPAPQAPSAAAAGLAVLKRVLAAERPELKPAEVLREAAKRWKAMGKEEREEFMATAV